MGLGLGMGLWLWIGLISCGVELNDVSVLAAVIASHTVYLPIIIGILLQDESHFLTRSLN